MEELYFPEAEDTTVETTTWNITAFGLEVTSISKLRSKALEKTS